MAPRWISPAPAAPTPAAWWPPRAWHASSPRGARAERAPVVFARKRFGQHFLHDRSVLDRIVRELDPQLDQALVEIGPGRGALTEKLLGRTRTLDAVEIDRDLAALLRERFGGSAGFELHDADALQFDLPALATRRAQRLRVIGNLPYNVSTPLLFHVAA